MAFIPPERGVHTCAQLVLPGHLCVELLCNADQVGSLSDKSPSDWPKKIGNRKLTDRSHFFMSRVRGYVYTLNNYTASEEEALQGIDCRYHIYGREVGESGTPHLQGFIYFANGKSFTAVKALLGGRVHLEQMRGTPTEASEYCGKDGDTWSTGELPSQGRRSDLSSIQQEIDSGKSDVDLANEHFAAWCQYGRRFSEYRRLKRTQPRSSPPTVYYIWGPTGTGKTRRVFDENEDVFVYPGGGWFDGFEGQETALFDDLRSDDGINFALLLRLLDRYPMKVPVKGGFVEWCPKKIYITSNIAPERLYRDNEAPLMRRITEVIHLTELAPE